MRPRQKKLVPGNSEFGHLSAVSKSMFPSKVMQAMDNFVINHRKVLGDNLFMDMELGEANEHGPGKIALNLYPGELGYQEERESGFILRVTNQSYHNVSTLGHPLDMEVTPQNYKPYWEDLKADHDTDFLLGARALELIMSEVGKRPPVFGIDTSVSYRHKESIMGLVLHDIRAGYFRLEWSFIPSVKQHTTMNFHSRLTLPDMP